METLWIAAQTILGLVILFLGGRNLVAGACGLATACSISPLVVGLTVVALGTSAPELAVTLRAALGSTVDLGIGNVVGSCIFNVLVILGITAVLRPLEISARLVRAEVPIMIALCGLTWLLALGGSFLVWHGGLLVALLVLYTLWTVQQANKERREFQAALVELTGSCPQWQWRNVLRQSLACLLGIILLVWGADWLVKGGVGLARTLGVSEAVIGLTLVAGGTSLPELATTLVAGARGRSDIAVGNVVGSNILNLLAVLGPATLLAGRPLPVSPEIVNLDLPVMFGAAMVCLPLLWTQNRVDRWEGVLLLVLYTLYAGHLYLAAWLPNWDRSFSFVAATFVLPCLALAIFLSLVQAWCGRRRSEPLAADKGPARVEEQLAADPIKNPPHSRGIQ